MTTILPCPFCSAEPVFTSTRDMTDHFDHCYSMHCTECGIEMTDEYESDLLARWNKRRIPFEATPTEIMMNAGYDAVRDNRGLPPDGFVLGHAGKIFVAMVNAGCVEEEKAALKG